MSGKVLGKIRGHHFAVPRNSERIIGFGNMLRKLQRRRFAVSQLIGSVSCLGKLYTSTMVSSKRTSKLIEKTKTIPLIKDFRVFFVPKLY